MKTRAGIGKFFMIMFCIAVFFGIVSCMRSNRILPWNMTTGADNTETFTAPSEKEEESTDVTDTQKETTENIHNDTETSEETQQQPQQTEEITGTQKETTSERPQPTQSTEGTTKQQPQPTQPTEGTTKQPPKPTQPTEETTKQPETPTESTKETASGETTTDISGDGGGKYTAFPSTSGALHVEGTKLVDSSGNVVQLKGISTHGIAWFPDYINEACFRQFRREWNVNVMRLAMYTAESGGYCSGGNKEQLKALVKAGVSYAVSQDMYIIIDWHILSDGNPNTHINEAKAFFEEMSAEYAGVPNVIYEICNEPNGGTGWNTVKSYAEQIIKVIRRNDEKAVILVGTPNWCQYVEHAAADPIKGYDNIMYTLHFYAATHTDWLRNNMISAINSGLPIFVSEYGICDANGNGSINKAQADKWVEVMNKYDVSYVAWNLSNKSETSSIIKSGCGKTSDLHMMI